MIEVERTDFVSVPVTDLVRARTFYAEGLGIPSFSAADAAWPEFETGNVSLYLIDPSKIGGTFSPLSASIALRVPDVAAARAQLEPAGSPSRARSSTPASATWRSSPTLTATR